MAWTIALFRSRRFRKRYRRSLTTYADRVQGEPVVNLISPTFLYFLFFVAGRVDRFVFSLYERESGTFPRHRADVSGYAIDPLS